MNLVCFSWSIQFQFTLFLNYLMAVKFCEKSQYNYNNMCIHVCTCTCNLHNTIIHVVAYFFSYMTLYELMCIA